MADVDLARDIKLLIKAFREHGKDVKLHVDYGRE